MIALISDNSAMCLLAIGLFVLIMRSMKKEEDKKKNP